MLDRDYVWCAAHMILDEEEALEALCPQCRSRAQQERCPVCGQSAHAMEGAVNPQFDAQRFDQLQKGVTP